MTINPDELSQITYAISYKRPVSQETGLKEDTLSQEEQSIYLRQTANIIKNKLKTLKNVTTLDIV
jgi:hypothetical protein